MKHISKLINEYMDELDAEGFQNIWFNSSKEVTIDGNSKWINNPIAFEDVKDAVEEDGTFANLFIKMTDDSVEEFNQVRVDLGEQGLKLLKSSRHECKNDILRFLVVKKTS